MNGVRDNRRQMPPGDKFYFDQKQDEIRGNDFDGGLAMISNQD